jgi:heat shock protein HslJ
MSDDFLRRLRERVDAAAPEIPVETALVVPRARRRRALRRSVGAVAAVAVLGGSAWTAGAFWAGQPSASMGGTPNDVIASLAPVPADQRVGLIGMWRVAAAGEGPGTFLRLAGPGAMSGLEVWRACGVIDGSWAVGPTRFVASTYTSAAGCMEPDGSMPSIPWLYSATAYQPDGDGWDLIDASGAITATLRHDGLPAPDPNVIASEAQAPVADDAARSLLSDAAPLPTGLRAATAAEVVGLWVPSGAPLATNPSIELAGDGTWRGSDGCNGAGGRWAVDVDGQFVIPTGGAMTAMGCDGAPLPELITTARRLAIDNGQLVLVDREGQAIARLAWGGPASVLPTAAETFQATPVPATPTATSTVGVPTTSPTTAPAQAAWQVSGAGIGPIRLGRTLKELADDPAVRLNTSATPGAPCLARFLMTPGYQISVEFAGAPGTDPGNGAVVASVSALALDGTSAIPVIGRSGVALGSSAAEVETAYPGGTWTSATTYSSDRTYVTSDGSVPITFGLAGDAVAEILVGRADIPVEFCG